jgi:hypothetical protein
VLSLWSSNLYRYKIIYHVLLRPFGSFMTHSLRQLTPRPRKKAIFKFNHRSHFRYSFDRKKQYGQPPPIHWSLDTVKRQQPELHPLLATIKDSLLLFARRVRLDWFRTLVAASVNMLLGGAISVSYQSTSTQCNYLTDTASLRLLQMTEAKRS